MNKLKSLIVTQSKDDDVVLGSGSVNGGNSVGGVSGGMNVCL